MRTPPPWAKTCRNPFIGHDWDTIPDCWVPNTNWPFVRFLNQRCTECGLVCARLVSANFNRHTVYDESTRPSDYRYTEIEMPDLFDFMDWAADSSTERRAKRQRKLELVPA